MTATLVRPEPGLAAAAPAGRARRSFGDGAALLALAVLFALVTSLTWRKWGVPEIDAVSLPLRAAKLDQAHVLAVTGGRTAL